MEINTDSFICILGRKGSGKSYFGKYLQDLALQQNIKSIIITPLKSLKDPWNPKLTFYVENQPKIEVSRILDNIMKKGNYLTLVDEAYLIFDNWLDASTKTEDISLSRFVRTSRHRNVGCIAMTQRPARFYSTFMSNSDYIVSFKQNYINDIERIAEICGQEFAQATTELSYEKHHKAIYDMKTGDYEIYE